MPTDNNSSSSTALRFFRPVNQSEPDSHSLARNHDPLELHENDVVWSFSSVSSDSSHPNPTATFRSQPYHQPHRNRFNPANSGLSAALSDDRCHLVSRRAITPAKRKEDAPSDFHRSAPVNIPAWPRNYGGKYSKRTEDNGEGEKETMVPPHVIVAKSHVTFSVFEGAGRTLKGRDMRRLRNTVFQKTGFID